LQAGVSSPVRGHRLRGRLRCCSAARSARSSPAAWPTAGAGAHAC
jgi:hypothetical protein